ncbi:hypothetical protein BC629DRAFT_1219319 [Irpex lacteus]|nr:hypothetical protein BC629DRAFT_1219319 [Irpex lacteus]
MSEPGRIRKLKTTSIRPFLLSFFVARWNLPFPRVWLPVENFCLLRGLDSRPRIMVSLHSSRLLAIEFPFSVSINPTKLANSIKANSNRPSTRHFLLHFISCVYSISACISATQHPNIQISANHPYPATHLLYPRTPTSLLLTTRLYLLNYCLTLR